MSLFRPTAPPLAMLRGVHAAYAADEVLHGIDLDVLPATVTVIAGANGAGKSTLLEVLAGTVRPTSGARAIPGAVIAFVPQRTAVAERMPVTVRDIVALGARRRPGVVGRLEARATVSVALERLGIGHLAGRSFATLSGGLRQRALLASGLARRADLLLLDEPTTGLDRESRDGVRAAIAAEAARGAAVVCVSHDPETLADADAVVHLVEGRIVARRGSSPAPAAPRREDSLSRRRAPRDAAAPARPRP